ncbi:MAG: aminoacyl-tRNA hydrolase, partial [Candidatus Spechtbacterales bacterium]
ILVIGLGNPGSQYDNTPHNAGFAVVDELVARVRDEGIASRRDDRKEYSLQEATIDGRRIGFVKPLLFMNHSGSALKTLLKHVEVTPDNMWLVHDEIDLPLGDLRVNFGSRSAGHNGVQDVIDKLGTKDFFRFRIGVRPPHSEGTSMKGTAAEYLTGKINGAHLETLNDTIEDCANLVERSLQQGSPSAGG